MSQTMLPPSGASFQGAESTQNQIQAGNGIPYSVSSSATEASSSSSVSAFSPPNQVIPSPPTNNRRFRRTDSVKAEKAVRSISLATRDRIKAQKAVCTSRPRCCRSCPDHVHSVQSRVPALLYSTTQGRLKSSHASGVQSGSGLHASAPDL